MNTMEQIKSLVDKNTKLQSDLTALQQDLKENNDKTKEVERRLQNTYSLGVNLFMIIVSFVITGAAVFFLLKWWINTDYSVFVGILLFPVLILSLIWDIAAVGTSTRKSFDKNTARKKMQLETLLQKKAEITARISTIESEIEETRNTINNLKLLQIKEEEAEKKRLEDRVKEIVSSEIIDRDELKAIADSGHVNAKIEMAKLLIEDYFSDVYTANEKKEKIRIAFKYLETLKNENNACEFLYLFCDSVIHEDDKDSLSNDLKRIREIKSNGDLSQKYDEMAERVIPQIVKCLDKLESKERSQNNPAERTSPSVGTKSAYVNVVVSVKNADYYDTVSIFVDGVPYGKKQGCATFKIPVSPGKHVIHGIYDNMEPDFEGISHALDPIDFTALNSSVNFEVKISNIYAGAKLLKI